jgi:phasin family protein
MPTRQYATIYMEGAEQMSQLPMQAVRDLFKSSEQLSATWLETSLAKALADWPALYQDSMQKAMEAMRAYVETAIKAQGELARFMQEQAALTNKGFLEGVQALASATSTGSEIAASAIRRPAEPVEHKPKKAA